LQLSLTCCLLLWYVFHITHIYYDMSISRNKLSFKPYFIVMAYLVCFIFRSITVREVIFNNGTQEFFWVYGLQSVQAFFWGSVAFV
jgi:hypothetical protein